LPDEYFNKKPNSAKKRPEKGQSDCLKTGKKASLFAVLLFNCHNETSKLQDHHQKFSSKLKLKSYFALSSLLMLLTIHGL